MLDLKAGQRVLDVGCGIGGGDFYMAEEFDAEVVGVDLSVNMISFALERSIGRKCAVEFGVGDCTKIDYPEASFDVVYSRDTILHIQVNYYICDFRILYVSCMMVYHCFLRKLISCSDSDVRNHSSDFIVTVRLFEYQNEEIVAL